ncbi:MAG: phosphoglucomutase/phosphomannomutase family protein [Candidatus Omnitrophota bacterium]
MTKLEQQIKFGTDGWRGVIGKDFNLKNVQIAAQAVSAYFSKMSSKTPCIAVGYDTRRLSRESAVRIAQVFAGNGIEVILSDRAVPSQVISYTVRYRRCTAGVMVTASHNPARYNGLKIKGGFGGPVEEEVTREIERMLFKSKPARITLQKARRLKLVKINNLLSDYSVFLRAYMDVSIFNKVPLKVLVDSMHGAGGFYIARLLKGTQVQVTTVRARRDPSFGGVNPEPIEKNLQKTSLLMRRSSFDICLVTDGDADRIAALDSRGEFISPQRIISLLLLHLLRYRKLTGAVVKTISGTSLLERIAQKYGLEVYETPVGFKHISSLMEKKNVLIGGEEAGGIGVKNYLSERDGLLCGLLLLEMMAVNNKSIIELLKEMEEEFGQYVYLRKDITCTLEEKTKIKAGIDSMHGLKTFSGRKVSGMKDYDGTKLYLDNGAWILFRLSGTEPIVRIYTEAATRDEAENLILAGTELLLHRDLR